MTLADRLISILYRFREIHLMDAHVSHIDVSLTQLETLMFIMRAGDQGCRIQEIAEGMGLTAPSVSVTVRRLEEKGWVNRETDPEDKRASIITLSEQSMQVVRRMKQNQRRMIEWFLSELDDQEQAQLVDLLDRAVTNAEKKNADRS